MRAPTAWLVLLLGIALQACAVEPDDEHIVLEPLSANASLPEKMLVVIPGGNVPNAHYVATARAIQAAATQLRLWVVVPAVFKRLCIISCAATIACAPLHQDVEAALAVAAGKGWKRADDGTGTFLAGHSLGGVCANTLFQAYSTGSSPSYAGLIVMGSYVDESGDYDLANYPKPVLILNGELDGGLARPGKTALWWQQHEALRKSRGKEYALLHKPVVLLPKVNHSDFCPGFNVPGDLMAEVDQATATSTISQVVSAFLHAQTSSVALPARSEALAFLEELTAWTEGFLTPYVKAQEFERNAGNTRGSSEGASPLCSRAQHIIGGLSEEDDARLAVVDGFHVKSRELEHCHPSWSRQEGVNSSGLSVSSCSHADYYSDFDNTGSITAASQIACKMLSAERLAQQLQTRVARQVDCREGNKYAVQVAEQLAPPSTLERYKRRGRGWCFLDDTEVLHDVGPIWVFSAKLELEENTTCMAVSSPFLKTALDGKVYPGNHYCKFLSPARALDWMMTDSLKPAPDAKAALVPAPASTAALWV